MGEENLKSLKEVELHVKIPKNLKPVIEKLLQVSEIAAKIFTTQAEKRYGKFGVNDPRHSNAENVMTTGEDEPIEVSYHEYFNDDLNKVIALLESTKMPYFKEVADALKHKEDTDFLKLKTILHKSNEIIHIYFGPFEQYDDPRHIRTSFQFDALLRSDRYENARKIFDNVDYNELIPEEFRAPLRNIPNFFVGDLFASGGWHQKQIPMAQVLPNEPSIRREYGTMITVYANTAEAKTKNVIMPLAHAILGGEIDEENAKKVTVYNSIAHEIMHTVGRKRENYSDLPQHLTFEEGKAMSGAVICLTEIGKSNPEVKSILTTKIQLDLTDHVRYILKGIDNFAYGAYSSYALSQLRKGGAISISENSIKIVNPEKYITITKELQRKMLEVVANKNKEIYEDVLKETKEFWNSNVLGGIIDKVQHLKIPKDISPKFRLEFV